MYTSSFCVNYCRFETSQFLNVDLFVSCLSLGQELLQNEQICKKVAKDLALTGGRNSPKTEDPNGFWNLKKTHFYAMSK